MADIPEDFARSTVARESDARQAWLDSLPELVDGLLQRWSCVPVGRMMHGEVGIIVPVRRLDATAAVMKVSFPHPGNAHEADAFATWHGRGAVRLYERDDDHFAMLLERVGSGTLAELEDVDETITVAGQLARRLAVSAPPELPRLSDRAPRWAESLRRDDEVLGHPLPKPVQAAAVATVLELGRDQPDTLVHGDLHCANVLRADREPWLVIDPKGYVGDSAYDALTVLAARFEELQAAADLKTALLRWLTIFADAAGVDRERARRWAQARAVTAAYWGRAHADPAWKIEAIGRVAELLT